jgi:hypothetical protein
MERPLLTRALVAVMALGSLALWVAVPVGWLWLTRNLEPAGTRFLITIVGCPLTMVGAGWALSRLENVYLRAGGIADAHESPPRPLERLLTASALLALVALVLWWVLLAGGSNPSGPMQPL